MPITSIASPIRVGLLGLSRSGSHHFERISLRSDLKVVAACDVGPGCRERAFPLTTDVCAGIEDLLARDDLDYVLIAAPLPMRAELALAALQAGKNVAVEPPMCQGGDEARAMLAAAERARRTLCVIPIRREELDFRAAREAVRAGALGVVHSARLVSWGMAVPVEPRFAAANLRSPGSLPQDGAFLFFAFQYLDQLLQLVRQPPRSVFARIPPQAAADPSQTVFTLSIGFDDGSDALIDVNLCASAALHTGWILAGSAGDYRGQRIYAASPSGEICDAPVTLGECSNGDIYLDLCHSERSERRRLQSARDAEAVMRLIDAARESSRTGETILLSTA